MNRENAVESCSRHKQSGAVLVHTHVLRVLLIWGNNE